MSDSNKNKNTQQILNFLKKEGFAENTDDVGLAPHSGDGSSRSFYTIKTETTSYCGVLPAKDDSQKGLAEAHAAFNIGSHLKKRGIAVPEIHGFDPVSGFILFEDLGETLLHDFLQDKKKESFPGEFLDRGSTFSFCFILSPSKNETISKFLV